MSAEFILVRKGDTFQGIALENSISVSSLKKINHIYGGGNSSLFVGQKLKVKDNEPPPSSLLAEASRSKILRKGSSSGNISWKGSVKPPPSARTSSSSVYDFITSSLWGSGTTKKNGGNVKLSTQSKMLSKNGVIDSEDEALSAGFRPRAGSGVGMKDLDSGEVIVTMPLTKSADFKKAQPQADEVIVEPTSKAKERNEYIKTAVLHNENTTTTSLLSIEGEILRDPEFDAELVEVNEHYFSSSNKKGGNSKSSKPNSPRNNGPRSRTRSFVKVDMQGNGCIMSQAQAQALASHLPAIYHANKWTLLYSVLNNGADLFSFYRLTKGTSYHKCLFDTNYALEYATL